MVRTIYLMRHGKAKRGPEYKEDFERPLADRGKRDSVLTGEFLKTHGMIPDLIISSAAVRTLKTASRVASAIKYDKDIVLSKEMYLSGPEAYIGQLKQSDTGVTSVMLVGHNPDLEELVQILSDDVVVMPTSALVRIDMELDTWADVGSVKGQLCVKIIPKALL
ncbi:MAG TPA: histidine phosphatase family protein [Thermodesulfovibrionia bacterium]|nr:histidine phosphatase family protein [Thermodesulfovibrionia bacterium]